MRWTNKGHEYDNIEMDFNSGTKVWIYGAGENGNELFHLLTFADCVAGFIDNDTDKIQKGLWKGKKIVSSETFLKDSHENCIVVVAVSLENIPTVIGQMIRSGWVEGKNLFIYHIFRYSYLPIWSLRSWGKIYIPTISFLVTTICNLDCIGCLNFTHFNQNKHHYDIECLKRDIDILFEKVDYVGYLHFSGGEPLLYPHLDEIIDYTYSNYNNRIGVLSTTTNGTILPTEKLCATLKRTNAKILVDDYRENVKFAKERFKDVFARLEKYGICPVHNYVDHWLDIQDPCTETDTKKLSVRCDACNVPFVSLKNHKIFACNYCDYAQEASILETSEYDYLDLEQINYEKRSYITEFIMGFSEKGYYSFCKKCSGFQVNNQKHIKVAEQY